MKYFVANGITYLPLKKEYKGYEQKRVFEREARQSQKL